MKDLMKSKYFIGIELPKKLEIKIDVLRQKYYPYGLKNVPGHITIAGPFYLSEEEIFASKQIEHIINKTKTLNINVEHFGTFTGDFTVFYAGVERTESLNILHSELIKKLYTLYKYQFPEHYIYLPHITIANRVKPADLENIISATVGVDLRCSFRVKHLSLFKKQGDQPYQLVERYTLDKVEELRYHPEADLGNGRHATSVLAT